MDDINQLMDNYAVREDETKGLKKKSLETKKTGGGKNKKGKNKKSASSDSDFCECLRMCTNLLFVVQYIHAVRHLPD